MIPKRILIVDENQALVESLASGCERLGFRARCIYDGRQVLAELLEFEPDLICLDASLKDADGVNVCELVAADPRCFGMPLIVLSGIGTVPSCHEVYAHYVLKCKNVWQRIEPLLLEMFPPCTYDESTAL